MGRASPDRRTGEGKGGKKLAGGYVEVEKLGEASKAPRASTHLHPIHGHQEGLSPLPVAPHCLLGM
jgi:hypothetical protein